MIGVPGLVALILARSLYFLVENDRGVTTAGRFSDYLLLSNPELLYVSFSGVSIALHFFVKVFLFVLSPRELSPKTASS